MTVALKMARSKQRQRLGLAGTLGVCLLSDEGFYKVNDIQVEYAQQIWLFARPPSSG